MDKFFAALMVIVFTSLVCFMGAFKQHSMANTMDAASVMTNQSNVSRSPAIKCNKRVCENIKQINN